MEIKDVASYILTLSEEKLNELNVLLKGHVKVTPDSDPTQCPQGYVWSSQLGKCVPDIG